MCGSRGGDRGSGPSLKNHKLIGFPSNTGPDPLKNHKAIIPIGQRPIALLDSSKSINIKSISTAATIYLMSTALQNCKINCLYSVLPGKLEVTMLITLINWY